MEQILEKTIDNGLASIASQLYIFSVGFGILLIVLGIILFFKRDKRKKRAATGGLICIGIGMVSIVSGLIQM